jgi:hypothetical protein
MSRTPCRYPLGPILRAPTELSVPELACEEVLHVPGARVVLAEYDVLQHDFPELRTESLVHLNPALADLRNDEQDAAVRSIIDEWLVANAAYVSTSQAAQAIVNSPIATDGRSPSAYRPPRYGRAIVVATSSDEHLSANGRFRVPSSLGLLDLKGAGVAPDREPSDRAQSNGLEHLGTALSDFLVKKVVDEILARSLPTVWSVPVYAVLDLGFDVIGGELDFGPAGLHVRRAHRRRLERRASTVEHEVTFEIECVLRRYGLTAATIGLQIHYSRQNGHLTRRYGRRGPAIACTDPAEIGAVLSVLTTAEELSLDRRDVQLAREVSSTPAQAQLVDFGALRIVSMFERPMLRYYERALLEQIVWPHEPEFIQPDSSVRVPVKGWERRELALLCLDLANGFRQGALSALEVRCTLDERFLAWQRGLPAETRD